MLLDYLFKYNYFRFLNGEIAGKIAKLMDIFLKNKYMGQFLAFNNLFISYITLRIINRLCFDFVYHNCALTVYASLSNSI